MVLWAQWAWLGSSHLGPLMRLDGRESEWTPGDGDGQGGLACCDSWGHKESDMTEQLNWIEGVMVKYKTEVSCSDGVELAQIHVHWVGDAI